MDVHPKYLVICDGVVGEAGIIALRPQTVDAVGTSDGTPIEVRRAVAEEVGSTKFVR